MPALEVELHPDAVTEARVAWQWYRARSAIAARAFIAELDRAIQAIGDAPKLWPRHVHQTRRYLLHRFPFSVVYRASMSKVTIIAVAHARRRPGYWRSRPS